MPRLGLPLWFLPTLVTSLDGCARVLHGLCCLPARPAPPCHVCAVSASHRPPPFKHGSHGGTHPRLTPATHIHPPTHTHIRRYKVTTMRVTHSAWDLAWCLKVEGSCPGGLCCIPRGRRLETFDSDIIVDVSAEQSCFQIMLDEVGHGGAGACACVACVCLLGFPTWGWHSRHADYCVLGLCALCFALCLCLCLSFSAALTLARARLQGDITIYRLPGGDPSDPSIEYVVRSVPDPFGVFDTLSYEISKLQLKVGPLECSCRENSRPPSPCLFIPAPGGVVGGVPVHGF